MKMFSMFSGIGGFEYGFEKVYGKAFKCIGYSEIDKYAIQVYEYHFPGVRNYGNARDVIPEQLPDFDILTGGFPCQSFSIAGKRGGFEDTRGTLFFEIARIVAIKRPKLLLLENVKGLLSHDRGRTFGTILATLSDLGYVCEWQILNSKDFGVPQNRERVFIIGHLGEVGRQAVFPIIPDGEATDGIQGQYANTITARYEGGQANGSYVIESELFAQTRKNPQGMRINSVDGVCVTISSQSGGLGQIRRLTPIECERLQGYPDNWTAIGTQGKISDSQRYKMCGNSVTTNVIEAIARRIIEVS